MTTGDLVFLYCTNSLANTDSLCWYIVGLMQSTPGADGRTAEHPDYQTVAFGAALGADTDGWTTVALEADTDDSSTRGRH